MFASTVAANAQASALLDLRPESSTSRRPRRPLTALIQPGSIGDLIFQPRRPPRPLAGLTLAVTLAALTATGCSAHGATRTDAPAASATAVTAAVPNGQSLPPWPAPADVAARVTAAGLDLGPMGMTEHYHPRLRIVIAGTEVPVPGNIGVDPTTGAMSALHTHEPDGTLHIEADTAGEVFTLGQLFAQWGVKLTATQIGGVKAKTAQQVTVLSNGTPAGGKPQDLRLQPDQTIELQLP